MSAVLAAVPMPWDEEPGETAPDDDEGVAAAAHAPARCAAALDEAALAGLIERIAAQDEKALAALYDATSARVHGLALRILQRPALAEEVVEDTYWQAWRQAPRFDPERGRPLGWLLAMARSRAIDALRRDERFRHEALPDEAAADDEGPCALASELLAATRGRQALNAALFALDVRSRQLVALAFFRGLTHDEIAQQEGLPLGTVKSLIRRALQQLRRVLQADGGPAG